MTSNVHIATAAVPVWGGKEGRRAREGRRRRGGREREERVKGNGKEEGGKGRWKGGGGEEGEEGRSGLYILLTQYLLYK